MASKIIFVISTACRWLNSKYDSKLRLVWCFEAIFPKLQVPFTRNNVRDFDLQLDLMVDTVTSWRHSMTHPNLFSLSSAHVDVLFTDDFFWFLFETLGHSWELCDRNHVVWVLYCLALMTSTSWRACSWRTKTCAVTGYLSICLDESAMRDRFFFSFHDSWFRLA